MPCHVLAIAPPTQQMGPHVPMYDTTVCNVQIVPAVISVTPTHLHPTHRIKYLVPRRVRCWFYFGRAVELGWTFLCSSEQVDPLLASVRTTPTLRGYQYGRFQMYLSIAGNGSLWFGKSELYTYSMLTNFYTCGVTVQPLNSTTVSFCCTLYLFPPE